MQLGSASPPGSPEDIAKASSNTAVRDLLDYDNVLAIVGSKVAINNEKIQ